MAKRDRQQQKTTAAPAAEVQQPEQIPAWLMPYQSEFALVDRFLNGEPVAEQAKAAFAAKLNADGGAHKGPVDSFLNQLVVIHGAPTELFTLAYNERDAKFKAEKAEQAILCAKEAGTVFTSWSKEEAKRVIAMWEANHKPAASGGVRKSVFAMLSGSNPAKSRFPSLYGWAFFQRQVGGGSGVDEPMLTVAMEGARLESQVADLEKQLEAVPVTGPNRDLAKAQDLDGRIRGLREQIAAMDATDEGEEVTTEVAATEPTLEDQIADLEAKRDAEATAKHYADAARLDDEITNLRTQLEASKQVTATATPATEAPVPTNKSGINTADDAATYCEANMANSKGLTRAYQRWEKDELTDEAFVAKVRDLAETSRATA